MKRVFRYIQKRSVFFESLVLVWMLVIHDGDHKHRMTKTTLVRPPISYYKRHRQKRHHLLTWKE